MNYFYHQMFYTIKVPDPSVTYSHVSDSATLIHRYLTVEKFKKAYASKLKTMDKLLQKIEHENCFDMFNKLEVLLSGNMSLNYFLVDDDILKLMKTAYGKSFDYGSHSFTKEEKVYYFINSDSSQFLGGTKE